MKHISSRVILIMAISNAFDLGAEAGDLARTEDSSHAQGALPLRPRPSQLVPPVGIQDSKKLNKTCCLNGGTCILGSFCACPPSYYGRNCEHNTHTQKCGSVPHGSWLPRKCLMCKCWLGQIHCFPQAFLPGCEGHVRDNSPASGTPGSAPSMGSVLLLAAACLLLEAPV
uniref:Teratocarcinoma-derived growth factor 1 n=1 Tax=Cavia porcellus TaxID=10141 RepID=A0A286XJG9_CAVPO